jgi:hypothetical protein
MAAKLDTPEGRALYKQRKAIIEPVFAQLFARFGRTLHYRGAMVTTEVHLWAAVHNMLKAIRIRARREQRERQATTPIPGLAAAYPAAAAGPNPANPARNPQPAEPQVPPLISPARPGPEKGQPEPEPRPRRHLSGPAAAKSRDSLYSLIRRPRSACARSGR